MVVDGKPHDLGLTPTEFQVLYALFRHNQGIVGTSCSVAKIIELAWSKLEVDIPQRTDDVYRYVGSIRKKLRDKLRELQPASADIPEFIETVKKGRREPWGPEGKGYRLFMNPRVVRSTSRLNKVGETV
jgi:DNA-binding response OmpR family regulator